MEKFGQCGGEQQRDGLRLFSALPRAHVRDAGTMAWSSLWEITLDGFHYYHYGRRLVGVDVYNVYILAITVIDILLHGDLSPLNNPSMLRVAQEGSYIPPSQR